VLETLDRYWNLVEVLHRGSESGNGPTLFNPEIMVEQGTSHKKRKKTGKESADDVIRIKKKLSRFPTSLRMA